MRGDVQRWFDRRTWREIPAAADLVGRKAGTTISVVLPALNEAATIGPIVESVAAELVERVPLVDELLVIDSGSDDDTAAVAAAAGADVVRAADVLPELGTAAGKGEALWKGVAAASGDLVVFLDADLRDFDARWVNGLVAPLLAEPEVQLVKAAYDRTLLGPDGVLHPTGGGRVTELVARPLIATHWPSLAGLAQPLAGEYAGRRALFERLPFVTGYGVELAMLLDTLALVGLDAIAQVDLGRRVHRNRPDTDLGRMAAALQLTALVRRGVVSAAQVELTQFSRDDDGALVPQGSVIGAGERPPLVSIPAYADRTPRTA
jgi:glucosyl-3-phosphoglycerate synthase